MNLRDAQLAHEASLQDMYDREHDDSADFRDYVLMACTYPPEEDASETLTDYFAFHEGDDTDIPACVPIGCNVDGIWTWGLCGCDYDEARAVKVHSADKLLPGEVERVFQTLLLKRETLENELRDARRQMVNLALPLNSSSFAALALRAAHLNIELKSLKAA